jgi:hypothetical protein
MLKRKTTNGAPAQAGRHASTRVGMVVGRLGSEGMALIAIGLLGLVLQGCANSGVAHAQSAEVTTPGMARHSDTFANSRARKTADCRIGQVAVRNPAQVYGAAGTGMVSVSLKNTSHTRCGLEGYAQIRLLSHGGRTLRLTVRHGRLLPLEPRHVKPIQLAPGGLATFGISYMDNAGPSPPSACHPFASVRVLLPGQHEWLRARVAVRTAVCHVPPMVYISPIGKPLARASD